MAEKRIKICFIVRHAYPLFNKKCKATHGGAEVQMYELGKKLSERGYEISFIVGDYSQKALEEFDGIRVYRQKMVKSKLHRVKGFWYFYQLLYFLLLRKIRADVYVINGSAPDVFFQSLYSFMLKAKFVFMTASDVDTDGRYREMYGKEGRFYEKGLKMADLVICQNQDQQVDLRNRYGLESGFITNSIEIPAQSIDLKAKKTILWVGTSRSLKQPEVFLKIVERYSEWHFTMIMPKHDLELWNTIFTKTKSYANLDFIERVPFDKINVYFQKAKLFVNTSVYEGFPVTFLQSAIFGAPVLTLNVDPDGFLAKYDCGYCANGSEDNLAEKVAEYLRDEKLWQGRSDNILKYVKEHHDIEKNVDKFELYIKEVLKK